MSNYLFGYSKQFTVRAKFFFVITIEKELMETWIPKIVVDAVQLDHDRHDATARRGYGNVFDHFTGGNNHSRIVLVIDESIGDRYPLAYFPDRDGDRVAVAVMV